MVKLLDLNFDLEQCREDGQKKTKKDCTSGSKENSERLENEHSQVCWIWHHHRGSYAKPAVRP